MYNNRKEGRMRYGHGSSRLFNIPQSFEGLYEEGEWWVWALTVVNKNPDEDIVVISKSEWDSLQETLRLAQNKELSDKVLRAWQKSELVRFNSMRLRGNRCYSSLQKMPGRIIVTGKVRTKKHWSESIPLSKRSKGTHLQGIGKPEPLKYDFQGAWSRRIDAENRLIYMLDESGVKLSSLLKIIIKSLKGGIFYS